MLTIRIDYSIEDIANNGNNIAGLRRLTNLYKQCWFTGYRPMMSSFQSNLQSPETNQKSLAWAFYYHVTEIRSFEELKAGMDLELHDSRSFLYIR